MDLKEESVLVVLHGFFPVHHAKNRDAGSAFVLVEALDGGQLHGLDLRNFI